MRGLERSAACGVDRAEALRYLGYSDQEVAPGLAARIEDAFALCERVARPAWEYRSFPVAVEGARARLVGSRLAFPAEGSLSAFAPAQEVAVMACTLGAAFDREARRLAVEGSVEALAFDAAGSSMVEWCADACEAAVARAASGEGLHAGQRTSPGYGDLPLLFSREVIAALDAGKHLGVSALDSGLLVPQKSVTAIVGLFADEQAARAAHRSCADCIARFDCAYLQAGNPCNPA